VNADINKQLVVLNVHVLSALNTHMSEADMKKLFDTDWMSVRLKKEIVIILLIKSMFIWIVKNQSVRD